MEKIKDQILQLKDWNQTLLQLPIQKKNLQCKSSLYDIIILLYFFSLHSFYRTI